MDLGGLFISLGLDAAEFTSALSKSEQDAKRAAHNIERDLVAMGRGIGAALGLAVTAAVALTVKGIDTAASLNAMTQSTGSSVEELSRLTQQAHVSKVSLDSVDTMLVELSKHLQGAGESSKNTERALSALGLKAADLKKLDPSQALKVVADRLNQFADGGGKAALAVDLLGKSGAQYLPFLKDLATDTEMAANVTAKQAAEADELQKQFRRLTLEAKNVGVALAVEISPWLLQLIEQFREGIKIAGGFSQALRLFGLSTITQDNAGAKIREISDEIDRLNKRRDEFVAQGRTGWTKTIDAQIADLKKQREFASLLMTQALGDRDNFDPSFGGTKPKLNYQDIPRNTATKKLVDELEKDRKAQIALAGRMLKADAEAMKYFADEIKKLDDAALKDREEQIRQVGRMIQADAQAQLYFRGEIEKFAKEAADAQKVAAEETSAFWDEAFRNMQRSASDFVYGLMQGEFDDFGTRFKQTMDRMVADWIAAQALMEATAFLGRRLGGSNDLGALTNIVGNVANWFSGEQAPAPVETRAIGGPVYPGQEYLVGERGPEIFRPRMSGAIIPNRQLPAQGDRAVYIQVNTPDADSFRRTKRQLAAEVGAAFGAMG